MPPSPVLEGLQTLFMHSRHSCSYACVEGTHAGVPEQQSLLCTWVVPIHTQSLFTRLSQSGLHGCALLFTHPLPSMQFFPWPFSWGLPEAVVSWTGEQCPSVDSVCLTLSSKPVRVAQHSGETRGTLACGGSPEGAAFLTTGLEEHHCLS